MAYKGGECCRGNLLSLWAAGHKK